MKLSVTNTDGDEAETSDYLFEKDRVTIGRGPQNDLTLPDPQRIVSSEHAEIRRTGRGYQLVDRGSTNFTYLRNQRLEADEPYPLADGDEFLIGNFEIEFFSTDPDPATSSSDETVFAADFSNPFADPTQDLLEALGEIVEAYEQEAPQRRDHALKDAVRSADVDIENREAVSQLLELLDLSPSDVSSSGSRARHEATAQPEPPTEATEEVLDTLLASLSRILDIPWQFRHEFIGQTIMHSSETKFLYEGDAETMKKHLLEPSLSQEERRERLSSIEDAADALVAHQQAMLDGYKASVMKGAEELLDQLDPDVHQDEVAEENMVYEYVPLLASPVALERLRMEWNDLKGGDWSTAEQRVFRPAFIKAYLARMSDTDRSPRQSSE